jgi:hypothetical protein
MADQTAVYALYVSIGSLMVSIVSACLARSAQKQAKKAATLESRREAIKHIGAAHFEVSNNGYVGDKAVNSIQEARKLAALAGTTRAIPDERAKRSAPSVALE